MPYAVTLCVLPGDLFFYEPGVSHSITADKDEPFLISRIHFDFKPEPAILVANTTYQLDFDFRLIGDSLLLTSVVRPETFSGFDTDMGGAQLLGESGKAYHVTLTFTTTDAKPTWHWWFGCADEGIVVVDNIRIDKLVLKK